MKWPQIRRKVLSLITNIFLALPLFRDFKKINIFLEGETNWWQGANLNVCLSSFKGPFPLTKAMNNHFKKCKVTTHSTNYADWFPFEGTMLCSRKVLSLITNIFLALPLFRDFKKINIFLEGRQIDDCFDSSGIFCCWNYNWLKSSSGGISKSYWWTF